MSQYFKIQSSSVCHCLFVLFLAVFSWTKSKWYKIIQSWECVSFCKLMPVCVAFMYSGDYIQWFTSYSRCAKPLRHQGFFATRIKIGTSFLLYIFFECEFYEILHRRMFWYLKFNMIAFLQKWTKQTLISWKLSKNCLCIHCQCSPHCAFNLMAVREVAENTWGICLLSITVNIDCMSCHFCSSPNSDKHMQAAICVTPNSD